MKPEVVIPTLPSFPGQPLGADRNALLTGLTFVELCTGWGPKELGQWFTTHGSTLGFREAPGAVRDASVGSIALKPGGRMVGDRVARADDLPKLLAMARWKVIVTLRGLMSGDDRFLQAAIFAGRARRDGKAPIWVARPQETDLLSDIVLSLFACDILAHRDFHEKNLCICDVCGRVSYNPRVTTRSGCADHIPGTATSSGVRDRNSMPSSAPPGPGKSMPPMPVISMPPPAALSAPPPRSATPPPFRFKTTPPQGIALAKTEPPPPAPAPAKAATEPPATPKLGTPAKKPR